MLALLRGGAELIPKTWEKVGKVASIAKHIAKATITGGVETARIVWKWVTILDTLTDRAADTLMAFIRRNPTADLWLARLTGGALTNGARAVPQVLDSLPPGMSDTLSGEALTLLSAIADTTGDAATATRMAERLGSQEFDAIAKRLTTSASDGRVSDRAKGKFGELFGDTDVPLTPDSAEGLTLMLARCFS